jgi:hypothetical protein
MYIVSCIELKKLGFKRRGTMTGNLSLYFTLYSKIEKIKNPGSVLLSHRKTAVPSALEGLTTVFGMGTGVTPPPLPPGKG